MSKNKNIFLRIDNDNVKNTPVDIDLQMTVFPVVLIEGTYVSQRGFYSSPQVNRVSINVIFDHKIYLRSSLFLLVLCLSLLSRWLFFSLHRTVDIFITAPLLKAINQHLVSGFSDAVKGTEQVNTREYFRLDL